ncbi:MULTISPECIES: hypothetical protein [Clostridium]|uniref:hypothetical protein n=1 Tax=Clostridium TaxID=1485 RepID=UPI00207A71E7|nr:MULTISPECIES: hypothetical protein [Clostridium]
MRKLHETNSGFYLDVLEDEEERLIDKLSDILVGEDRYLFFRYVAVRDIMHEIKTA